MRKKTQEEYVEELKIKNPNVELLGKYINTNTPVEHFCKIHNKSWYVSPNSILNGTECYYCGLEKISSSLKQTQEEYESKLKESNPQIICIDEYIDSFTSILHKCLICNNEWKAIPSNLLRGHSCPKCNISKGESMIERWLKTHNFDYELQKRFEDCKDNRTLPFDFYLPKENKCIEFDGKQHYESVDYFGGNERLKYTQEHDEIKNKYCEDNNIPLLRIPYYADVETELNNFLFN